MVQSIEVNIRLHVHYSPYNCVVYILLIQAWHLIKLSYFFVTAATSFNVVSIESFSSHESNEHITLVAQIHSLWTTGKIPPQCQSTSICCLFLTNEEYFMHVLLQQHIALVSTFPMNPLSCSNMEKWLRYNRLNLASLFSHSSQIWHNNLAQGHWPALSCQVIVPCLVLVADMMLYTIQ